MKKFFLLLAFVQIFSLNIWAGDDNRDGEVVLIVTKKSEPAKQHQFEVPVNVDIFDSLVGVHFESATDAKVTVKGASGTVYSNQVNTSSAKSLYIDLSNESEGGYTITIEDKSGNEVEGDFTNYKE